MGLIFDTMTTYFTENGWNATRIGDGLGLSMTVQIQAVLRENEHFRRS